MDADLGGYAARADIERVQAERLRDTLGRAWDARGVYRERWEAADRSPDDVDEPADLAAFPFTTKADFRAHYPDGLFAVDREALRRFHASSGTTGKPKIVGYTGADLDAWADLTARTLATAGVEPGDVVQNAAGYGLFTGGLGWHYGVERLGAAVLPIGAGNTARQLTLMEDLSADALVTIPSYALHLAEAARERGLDPASLGLGCLLVGAEPSSAALRADIAETFHAVVTENYGLSECFGPGVATECAEATDGMHLWEDAFYPEVVDPETDERLPEGEEGELVLTALASETLPLVRYRTGDLATLTTAPCDCGRAHARVHITGRRDDMLVVRGVNVYPTEVESVLLEFDALSPQYRLDVTRPETLDRLAITVERNPAAAPAEVPEEALQDRLASVLSLTPDEVDVVEPRALERSPAGKVQRVYDHRER